MFQILNEIYSSELKDKIAFKWGTLAYFLYGLPRFSTDLDFDLIAPDPRIMDKLKTMLNPYWRIKDEKDKANTYFFLLNYGEHEHNIKIEVSKKMYTNTHYSIVNFFWKPILAMDKQSIFAHKLVALSERFKNRDLFDVYYFFSSLFPIDQSIIQERTKLNYPDFLVQLSRSLPEHFTANTILAEIWDLITEKQKYFMKTKIVAEVQSYLELEKFNYEHKL